MYLWIVLGTFMVALLSFSLPIRSDIDRQNNEMKAQTVVTKFRAQHNAFRQYIESHALKKNDDGVYESPETVPYYSGLGYKGSGNKSGQMLPSYFVKKNIAEDGFRSGLGVSKPFNASTELTTMRQYLPFGFKEDSNIYSKVYCFATEGNDKFNYSEICEEHDDFRFSDLEKEYCCSRSDVDVYVISWQEMPARWKQPDPLFPDIPQPIADMMAVIAKSDGYGFSFGYVTYLKGLGDSSTAQKKEVIRDKFGKEMFVDRGTQIMSGGMYRTLRVQRDANGKSTGVYKEDLGYRPIFNILLRDPDFSGICAYNDGAGNSGILNPCLIAVNRVNNREGAGK